MSKVSPVRAKMSREERAKQFMPFAALKGYEEALRAKEREVEAMHAEKHESIEESEKAAESGEDY